MSDTNELFAVTQWLSQSHRPLLLSHARPDGDALGSLAAMALALKAMGKEPTVALFDAFPPRYGMLRDAITWHSWEESREVLAESCDGVIIVDTCALAQVDPALDFLRRAPRMLVIDHHVTRDPLATRDGDLRLIDETAAAACVLIAEWVFAAGVELSKPLAEALFIGIGTDCGWFKYSNTDARTLRIAARLVEAGVEPAKLFNAIYQQEPIGKLRLIARLLTGIQLRADGRLAVLTLRPADFEAAGADKSMTEDLVNEVGRLAGVECTLLFTEEPDGVVRVNLRSKERLDVAEVARRYGGGGHARAAGCRLRGEWDRVVSAFVNEIEEAV
ncbi:MAG: DHH family phosphoesterase [Phycisphaerae bacterium]